MVRVRQHPRYISAPAPELTQYHPESQKLVWMSPERYLSLVGVEYNLDRGTGDDLVIIGKLMKRIRKGLEIDPLFLDIDVETGQVVSQEGIHRAIAAKNLNVSEIPVILYAKEKQLQPDGTRRFRYTSVYKIPELK